MEHALPPLIHGRIVWATVPDPQGRNEKRRRCLLITSNSQIASGGLLRIVGITSELTESPAEHYVRLQHGERAWSGLREPSAALGTWVIDISQSLVESTVWFIRPQHLKAVQDLVIDLEKQGYPIPCVTILA